MWIYRNTKTCLLELLFFRIKTLFIIILPCELTLASLLPLIPFPNVLTVLWGSKPALPTLCLAQLRPDIIICATNSRRGLEVCKTWQKSQAGVPSTKYMLSVLSHPIEPKMYDNVALFGWKQIKGSCTRKRYKYRCWGLDGFGVLDCCWTLLLGRNKQMSAYPR